MDLNKLDAWITRSPYDYFEPELITQEIFNKVFGEEDDKDIHCNEFKCAWSGVVVGYHDYEDGNDQLHLVFTEFYHLDGDGEILVERELYEAELARQDAVEREIDIQRKLFRD